EVSGLVAGIQPARYPAAQIGLSFAFAYKINKATHATAGYMVWRGRSLPPSSLSWERGTSADICTRGGRGGGGINYARVRRWCVVVGYVMSSGGGGGGFCGGDAGATETFWMWILLWKETRLRQLMSSPGAPSAGPSILPNYSSGPSTPPSYSLGPSTPPNYSSKSSKNAECSNCKHLRGKISVLKATINMHPKQHTANSAALLHEVLNDMNVFMIWSSL
nr:hypothetical protein [Tanacetum cinerariifolium]